MLWGVSPVGDLPVLTLKSWEKSLCASPGQGQCSHFETVQNSLFLIRPALRETILQNPKQHGFYQSLMTLAFSRQEYWSGLPFPSPVDHIVSDLSTMPARLVWPHRVWLSFIELDKAVVLVWLDWLVFCGYVFSVSALLQHLPSYLGFSYLGRGVSPHRMRA